VAAVDPVRESARQRAQGVAALVLLAAISLTIGLHATPGQAPPPIPAAQAEPWMADCLPRIGTRTRTRMAAALRAGDLAPLPPPAKVQAARWFTW
jgi:hypothetical protein